jgi:hypothetical protein
LSNAKLASSLAAEKETAVSVSPLEGTAEGVHTGRIHDACIFDCLVTGDLDLAMAGATVNVHIDRTTEANNKPKHIAAPSLDPTHLALCE